jgi:hypothetical protein
MLYNLTFYLMADVVEAVEKGAPYSIALSLLFGLGFIAAVTFGSIAWYNSKRPLGWEDKKRPDIVPEIKKEENPGLGSPNS